MGPDPRIFTREARAQSYKFDQISALEPDLVQITGVQTVKNSNLLMKFTNSRETVISL